jgi:hypothetical protein
MSDAVRCPWCTRLFRPRRGGHAQRYCRPSCRRECHAAARVWTLAAIASGALSPVDVRSGPAATRTLPLCEEEQARRVARSSVDLSLSVLPDVIEDLGRLGWLGGLRRLDDAVADAVVELVERGIALGLRPSTDPKRYRPA